MSSRALLFGFVSAVAVSVAALSVEMRADEPKERTFTDPAKAGPDYGIQGEYEGRIGSDTIAGLQVVALGDGKFDGVLFAKGLPGSGADKTRVFVKGENQAGIPTFTGENYPGDFAIQSSLARSTTLNCG